MGRKIFAGSILGGSLLVGSVWLAMMGVGQPPNYAGIPCIQGQSCTLGNLVVRGSAALDGGTGTGSAVWQTAMDCPFPQQPVQLLPQSAPHTFTACGGLWTFPNPGFDHLAAIDGGLGLVLYPDAGVNFPMGNDVVYLSLASIIPGFNGAMPVEVDYVIGSPAAGACGSDQFQVLAVSPDPGAGGNPATTEMVESLNRCNNAWIIQSNSAQGGSPNVTVSDTTNLGGVVYNVGHIVFPNGLSQGGDFSMASIFDGGMPSLGGEHALTRHDMFGNGAGFQAGPVYNWNVALACDNNGGAFQCSFLEVMVRYKN